MKTTPKWALLARRARVYENLTEYNRTLISKYSSKLSKMIAKDKVAELQTVIRELNARIYA